jgi:mannose-6-phosphate isomerase-like protein (cupin superfamily)
MILTNINDFKPFKALDDSEVIETIGLKTTGTEEVSFARAVVKPKRKTIKHYHDFLEIYFIDKGDGIIRIHDEVKNIKNGDSIIIPKKSWHMVENIGDGDLVIWCICVPAFSESQTVMSLTKGHI